MTMNNRTCKRCKAPEGATIWRRANSLMLWTASACDASRDPRFSNRPRLIALNSEDLCQDCAPKQNPWVANIRKRS